jgi:hypothetical protein
VNIRIPDDVVFRVLGDEAVILNLASGVYFGLDTVGTRMWQLMSEHESTETVVEALLAEYEVEKKQLRCDLDDLIRQLSDKGLMTIDAAEAAPAE